MCCRRSQSVDGAEIRVAAAQRASVQVSTWTKGQGALRPASVGRAGEDVLSRQVPVAVQVLCGREFISLSGVVVTKLDGGAVEIARIVEDQATVCARSVALAEPVQNGFAPDDLLAAQIFASRPQTKDAAAACFDSSVERGSVEATVAVKRERRVRRPSIRSALKLIQRFEGPVGVLHHLEDRPASSVAGDGTVLDATFYGGSVEIVGPIDR